MILSRLRENLSSFSVQYKNLGKISNPVQILTTLFFAFVCIMSARFPFRQAAAFTLLLVLFCNPIYAYNYQTGKDLQTFLSPDGATSLCADIQFNQVP